jgi:type II secretory pathway pseudopilin PulG
LIELMVVIGIISVLASMTIMVVTMVRERARRAQTSNHLREISAAMMVYGDVQAIRLWLHGLTNPPTTPMSSMALSGGLFENLARVNELSTILFCNPINPDKNKSPPRPYAGVLAAVDATDETCLLWAASFAFDWSVPHNAGSVRVVIGDRSPGIWGNKGALMAYVDGHCDWINNEDERFACDTFDFVDRAAVRGAIITRHASVADNVYRWGEAGGEDPQYRYRFGRGSSSLAWLR